MKKVLFISALAITVGLASCKKDWNCTCSYPVSVGLDPEIIPIQDATKADAETACDTYNALAILSGGSCTLD